jgi:peptide/nickel transport system substrate-binding protein
MFGTLPGSLDELVAFHTTAECFWNPTGRGSREMYLVKGHAMMGERMDGLQHLRRQLDDRSVSRRDVLKRGAALGLSAPVIAGLLAACGDDSNDENNAPTSTTGTTDNTPSAGGGAGTPPTGGSPSTSEEASPEATNGGGQRGGAGEVRLLYWQAPTILNPHFSQGTKDDEASRVCLEPLAEFGKEGDPVLYLAEEFPTLDNGGVSEDGKEIVWKLRKGVKWHDGEDFNADDVVFTWQFASNPETAATTADTYMRIKNAEKVDDYTVKLTYEQSNPAWADAFTGTAGVILPEHVFKDHMGSTAHNAPANLDPVGTGPYKVREFRPGDVVIYDLFPDYWDEGKPHFDTVNLKGGGDSAAAARGVLETGEGDWAWNVQIEPNILLTMLDAGEGIVVSYPGSSAERIMINFADPNQEVNGAKSEPSTEHPLFKHKEARNALALAMRRDVIATQLYGAGSKAEQGVTTSNNLNAPERFVSPNTSWEYDIDKAKEMMDKVPDAQGYHLLYQTSINSVRQKTQQIVKEDLEKLGLVVELKAIPSEVFFSSDAGNPDTDHHFYADIEMYTNGPTSTYPIAWAQRYRSDDIAQQSNKWSGTNITRYQNPEYDKLHDQARVELDPEKQNELFIKMNDISVNDFVEIPLVHRGGVSAAATNLDGYDPGPFVNETWDLKNWTRKS